MTGDVVALLPEICLLMGAVVTLISGSFLPRRRQWVARLIAVAALLASAATAADGLHSPARSVFDGTYTVDVPTGAARLIVVAATLLVFGLGVDELADDPRESETYTLFLLASAGAVVLAGSSDLLVLAVAFLLATIPLYGLIGLSRTPAAAEAALKTYLLGALFGITLLLGVTVLYAVSGETAYSALPAGLTRAPIAAVALGVVAVLAGLMFKAGGVPGHFWVPDAAQGAGGAAAAFLTTVPKIGALVAAYRLVLLVPPTLDRSLLVGVLAVASMSVGNLAAFFQDDPRRLLGWSTVSQVGYLLLPVAVAGRTGLAMPSLLLYLAGYAVTNLTCFAVVAAFPARRDLASFQGLVSSQPWLAGALAVSLLSLVGTPPTAVFAGKLTTFAAAWDGGLPWLAVVAAVNTVTSLFYYLRWIAPAFRPGQPIARAASGAFSPREWAAGAAVIASLATVAVGVASGAVWSLVNGPPMQ